MPNNESSIFTMSRNDFKKDNSSSLPNMRNQDIPRKRRWSLGRLYSIETNEKNNNYLERRMTLPLLRPKTYTEPKCELKALVQNHGSHLSESFDHITLNSLFKFWKSEDDLGILLRKMDVSSTTEISRICNIIIKKSSSENMSITEFSQVIQDIYRIADLKIRKNASLDQMSEGSIRKILMKFEDKLMRGLHEEVFEKILLEETENDQTLTSIIEELSWITPKHLLAKVDDSDKTISDLFDKAMLDIATIYFKESPVAKLKCIMSCSQRIFDILKIQQDLSEPADDFLSIMVFVILQANPARLHSNIRYILQFGNCNEIMRSEEGYYFTHLCSVVSFIENLSAQSLNLSEEEFRHFCESSGINDGNSELRTRRISCSRQMSLNICRIYHKAAYGLPSKLQGNVFYDNTVALQKKILFLHCT